MSRMRINFEMSAVAMRRLILWAASRENPKSQWARTVVILRTEENWPKVEAWLQTEAKAAGLSVEDFERKILADNGFDFEEYQKEVTPEDV